jgi:hypothetical protein
MRCNLADFQSANQIYGLSVHSGLVKLKVKVWVKGAVGNNSLLFIETNSSIKHLSTGYTIYKTIAKTSIDFLLSKIFKDDSIKVIYSTRAGCPKRTATTKEYLEENSLLMLLIPFWR